MNNTQKKTLKRTNTEQFKCMVDEMEENVEIARGGAKFGKSRMDVACFWDNLSKKLNSLGPPQRRPLEWKKVWVDFKASVKNKHVNNKKKIDATGGGPYDLACLNPLEQAVDSIINLDVQVNPVGRDFGEDNSENADPQIVDIVDVSNGQASASQASVSNQLITDQRATYRSVPRRNVQMSLLQQQTNVQESVLEVLKKLEKSCYENKKILKDIRDIKREKLKFLKEKATAEEENLQKTVLLDLQIKQAKLELLEKQLNNRCVLMLSRVG